MYKLCSAPFLIVSLSTWSTYFLTVLDFILAKADVFWAFHPLSLTDMQAHGFDISPAPLPFSLVLLIQNGDNFNVLTISPLSSSYIIDELHN